MMKRGPEPIASHTGLGDSFTKNFCIFVIFIAFIVVVLASLA
jgi:hypothetical protein